MPSDFTRQRSVRCKLKVLVTGGSGFLGRHLCRRFCHAGSEVHATSRRHRPNGDNEPIWHVADMANLAAVRQLIASVKPDIVFHLAGSVGASPDLALVLPTYRSLLTSTVVVLLAATEFGCQRIILTSSLTEPMSGDGAAIPQAPYAAAKWAASGYGRMFHSLYNAPVVLLRPFMTYGPGQAVTKLIPSVTMSLLRRQPPKLASGRYSADWIYIADVIEAFFIAASVPDIEGKTFDLGSGALVSVRDIVGRLVDIAGNSVHPDFGALPDRPSENIRMADVSLAANILGWRATTSLNKGLQQTVEWYKAMAEGDAHEIRASNYSITTFDV